MATDVGTLQSKLTLDFSQFASGMNSAISMVRSFGNQLQKALGSNATQGFSTTNQVINDIRTSITNLQAAVSNFQATMQNTNTTLAQFSNVQANTSRMGQNLQQAANGMRNVSKSAQGAAAKVNGVSNNSKKAAQNAKKLSGHLNEAQRFAENLKRILGGIVVSQAFYKMLGIMQDLVSSSVQFMTNMEQSAISFKYLLGSAENSAGFLEALQDFAITSPMDMQGAEAASRMLMTMGFEAEHTIAVLRTLTDASTVAGGDMSDTVYRIALALGQMLQSGTVKMQELRQLVNANIPIFDILQEELGLTAEQIANIGDASVDSGQAVMAILRGLQKRFGGASLEMQQTVTGALSASKDSFYVLFNEVMAGPYENFRKKLVRLSEILQQLAQIARQYGAGGVFEAIIPERLQNVIRNVVGAFMQLGQAIAFLGRIATEVFGGMGEIIMHILNIVLPPITILLNAILQFTYGLMKAYPIIKYFFAALMLLAIAKPIGAIFLWFWKVLGLGKIILTIVGYIKAMAKALMLLGTIALAHPIITTLTIITVAVLALTGVLQKAISKIKEFFSLLGAKITTSNKTMNQNMGIGYDPNKILQPTDKETNENADKYKNSLSDISNKLSEVGDEASKTKNKLKNAFNQSFDEIYTINQNTGDDLGISGLEDLDLSVPLLELGEFNDMLADLGNFDLSSWSDSFMVSWREMWESIKQRIKEYGIPALLSALGVGMLTKNPWAALAAGLATLFWPEIANALGLSQEEGNRILGKAIGTLLGGVIGNLVGGPAGAVIGAAIGLFCGDVLGLIMNGFQTAEWDYAALSKSIGTALGIGIGFAVGGPGGAVIGGAIGNLVGRIVGALVDGFATGNWDVKELSMSLGTGIGAAIGFVIGGPAGALIGGLIGNLIGWIVNKFIEADWAAIGDFIVGGISDGIDWATSKIFEPIGRFFKAVWEGFCNIFGIHSPAEEMKPIGKNVLFGILEGIVSSITEIPGYIAEAGDALMEALARWFVNIGNDVRDWFGDGVTAIQDFVSNTGRSIEKWVGERVAGFTRFKNHASATVSTWATDTKEKITNWVANTGSNIGNWWSNVKTKFDAFKGVSFTDWCNSTLRSISTWCSDVWSTIKDKIGSAIDKIREFLGLNGSSSNFRVDANVSGSMRAQGHATGGIYNREHWARFAEGNKAEAIIPLENASAMQPFVDAVADGLTASFAPIVASMNNNNSNNMQPLYVGTLIADERSLKELQRKMQIIQLQEDVRRGH